MSVAHLLIFSLYARETLLCSDFITYSRTFVKSCLSERVS